MNKFTIILVRGYKEIEVEVPDRGLETQRRVLEETGADYIKLIQEIEIEEEPETEYEYENLLEALEAESKSVLPPIKPEGNKFYTVNEVSTKLDITPQQLRKQLRKLNFPKLSNGKYGLTAEQIKELKKLLNK